MTEKPFLWSHPVWQCLSNTEAKSRESKHFRLSLHSLSWLLVQFNRQIARGETGNTFFSPLTGMEIPVRGWQAEIKRWVQEKRNEGDKNTPYTCNSYYN